MELKDKVAIVTGASRGLGAGIARALAAHGAHVALAARSEEALGQTRDALEREGRRAIAIPTDVTDISALEALVDRTSAELGPPDLLVNNAGIERYTRFEDADPAEIEDIVLTNVIAAQWLTRLVLPGMLQRGRGHIVNISSVAGKTAVPFNAVYSATKHALVGFSWSLRQELRGRGVGVSVVCPGFVAKEGMFADWSQGQAPPGIVSTVEPGQVAAAVVDVIVKNRAEAVVAPLMMKAADIMSAVSPDLVGAIARRTGSYRFLEEVAVPAWRDRDSG